MARSIDRMILARLTEARATRELRAILATVAARSTGAHSETWRRAEQEEIAAALESLAASVRAHGLPSVQRGTFGEFTV